MNFEVFRIGFNTAMTSNRIGWRANPTSPNRWKASQLLGMLIVLCWHGGVSLRAEIPEPDNVFYGIIQFAVTPITALDTNVIVEARKGSSNGPVVATYRMGSSAIAKNFYSLRVPVEAFNPLSDANSSRVGALIHLSVRDDSGVRVTKTTSLAGRGKLERIDFTQTDTDGDGLPDSWESRYFGNVTGADPNGDPDGDGRNNLQEYLTGTNPLVADGGHPADNAPSDNILSADEADAYANAWLVGSPWPLAPTNIPIAYVTRAALLAFQGGGYVFTNSPPTNAPNWWVSSTGVTLPTTTRTNIIRSSALATTPTQSRVTITLTPIPASGTIAYAVEDQVPQSWQVQSVSHGGTFDSVQHKVRWGPFLDDGERDLTYDVTVGSAQGPFTLVGNGSFDGVNVAITGTRVVTVGSGGGGGGAAPKWVDSGVDATGPFYLLKGDLRSAYVIESSIDLVAWQTLQTISTDGTGQTLFRPTQSNGTQPRFFRARIP